MVVEAGGSEILTINELTKNMLAKNSKNVGQKDVIPNEQQRREMCELLHYAFTDIRTYAHEGKYLEAAELADIFHNIPNEMYGDGLWDLATLIQRIETHQKKNGGRDYASHLKTIFQLNPAELNSISIEGLLQEFP
jgi:uncharacterized protein (DUF2267 family)